VSIRPPEPWWVLVPGTTPHNFPSTQAVYLLYSSVRQTPNMGSILVGVQHNPSFRPPPSPNSESFNFHQISSKLSISHQTSSVFRQILWYFLWKPPNQWSHPPLEHEEALELCKKKMFYTVYILVTQSLRIFSTRFSLKSDFEKSWKSRLSAIFHHFWWESIGNRQFWSKILWFPLKNTKSAIASPPRWWGWMGDGEKKLIFTFYVPIPNSS